MDTLRPNISDALTEAGLLPTRCSWPPNSVVCQAESDLLPWLIRAWSEYRETVAGKRARARTVEDYHAFGWRILTDLHDLDPAPWPDEVPADPDSPGWSMCFNGMALFCNMSSPAYRKRRSRNLGGHFVIVARKAPPGR